MKLREVDGFQTGCDGWTAGASRAASRCYLGARGPCRDGHDHSPCLSHSAHIGSGLRGLGPSVPVAYPGHFGPLHTSGRHRDRRFCRNCCAAGLAYHSEPTFHFGAMWSVVTALPLVIPSYVAGFLVVIVLGPRGMLQGWLAPLGVERLPEIFGFPGAAFTLTLLSYPYVLLPVRAALGNIDPSLEETSSLLGKSAWATFFRVTLPLLRPAIAAGALLVALYTLSDFGAVSLLRYETFTWAIYVQYGYLARDLAAALSLVLVALALTILVLEASARGRAGYHRSATGAVRPAPTVRLGRWRWPALALCSTIVLLSLVMPMSVLGYWVVRGVSAGEALPSLWGPGQKLAVRFRDCCPRYHTGGRAHSNADGPLPGPAQQYAGAIHLPWFCSAGRCGCPCAGLLRCALCHAVVPDPGTPHLRLHGPVPSNSSRSRQVFAAPGGSRAGGRRQKPWAHAFACPAFNHRATGASRYTCGGGSGFPLDHERAPGYPYT